MKNPIRHIPHKIDEWVHRFADHIAEKHRIEVETRREELLGWYINKETDVIFNVNGFTGGGMALSDQIGEFKIVWENDLRKCHDFPNNKNTYRKMSEEECLILDIN
tara:strand:- start:2003 stop:2320 length:318 start_codon:yes stop_codon:yes gene_type:complete